MATPTRIFDLLYYQQQHFPQQKCMGHRHNDKDTYYSTAEVIDVANKAAQGLLAIGVQRGDKIALVAYKNRPEWSIMDLAIQQVGAISVPVYPTISSREYEYVFNDSHVKYAFCGDGDLWDKLKETQKSVPSLIDIYTFDRENDKKYWEDIFKNDRKDILDEIRKSVTPHDLVTIIYTSGTTGLPKGVMLSHENMVSNVMGIRELLPISPGDAVLSFLPLCHIFERACSFTILLLGGNLHYTGTDNLGGDHGDLRRVQPAFFTTVPRLLEKVYERLFNKGLELTGIKKSLFFWALKLTNDHEIDVPYTGFRALQHKIADKLIYSKWREALGGNIKGIVIGAAPCPVKVARTFCCAGVPIREGYGLTESSPGLVFSGFYKGGALLGTVGMPLHNVEIMIDSSDGNYREGEGEILAAGPNIMVGYYNKPDKTAEVIREMDGKRWLLTGDIGTMVKGPGGKDFLKITDRKKELFKTSGGKYVAPAPIESRFKENFLIEQIMLVGDNEKFVSALIVPAMEALKDWCQTNNVAWDNDTLKHPKVLARYQEIADRYNPDFSHIEQVKKMVLVNASWDVVKEDGTEAELTPTMKLKRRVILKKHKIDIDAIYGEKEI